MELWEQMSLPEVWQDFLEYKAEKHHLSKAEQRELETYISEQTYLEVLEQMNRPEYELPIPLKKEVNKSGVSRKRVVYSFPREFNMFLKIQAYLLYRYDDMFAENCYAFRRSYGVKDAVKRIRMTKDVDTKYCLKADISNYFNSIDVEILIDKLMFLKERDEKLYDFQVALLKSEEVLYSEKGVESVIREAKGAMAGTPVSPFWANVYLMDVDRYFHEKGVMYFRYSDDILIFADSKEELEQYREDLFRKIREHKLQINPDKVHISAPGEGFEFLGFAFRDGEVDLSDTTLHKIKGKIKRKAHALRRWQQQKGLPGDRAAKGFIKAMNRKFFDSGDGTEFSWSRWFFPCLTTDAGLKEVDAYMQQYIRYCVTGRHYKGNYRTTYQQMKEWGYRSLVHEFYEMK